MLPLLDKQVRLVLLNHLAVRLKEGEQAELHSAGIEAELAARLRSLSPLDLNRLATMREPAIEIAVDSGGLRAGLRALRVVNEARALETYFIRNGASWQMMNKLFKLQRRITHKRRHECEAWRPPGRMRLPDLKTRERIFRAWLAIHEPNPRLRYYRLHRSYPRFAIAILEAVVLEFEESL